MSFSGFKLWAIPLWGGGTKNNNSKTTSSDNDYENGVISKIDTLKSPLKCTMMSSTCPKNKKVKKKKWNSIEERKIESEHDVVVVPNDGVSLSESEAEDSDWSIGWLEPHGPDFMSDDETDDSFAVLVPCYKDHTMGLQLQGYNGNLLNAIRNLSNECFAEENFMEQWKSNASLQKF